MARRGFGTYLKAAFRNRWNLLALAGATGAAVLSGQGDVLLPLIAAAEILYLGMISTNGRFHRLVDAMLGAEEASQTARALGTRFDQLYRGLDPVARARFDELRERCEVLRDLTGAREEPLAGVEQVASTQLSGVNRLLWVYLKLLHTRGTLESFFESVDLKDMERAEKDAKARLEALPKDSADLMVGRMRKSLEDTLATAVARRENVKKAEQNLQYVGLELERIGAKLTAISELAVNRQDPGLLTHDVDDVARSVQATEDALGELQSFTGFTAEDVQAPEILSPPPRVRA